MFFGKQKFDVKHLKLNKFIFGVKRLKINKFIFDFKQLKMNTFIKSISDLIVSTSNTTLEVPSIRPCISCLSLDISLLLLQGFGNAWQTCKNLVVTNSICKYLSAKNRSQSKANQANLLTGFYITQLLTGRYFRTGFSISFSCVKFWFNIVRTHPSHPPTPDPPS